MGSAIVFTSLLVAGLVSADGKPAPGTKGTVTGWEPGGGKVIAVEACTEKDGDWDYVGCSHVLRKRVVDILCKRGPGAYKWGFQVGDEKPFLMESTSCK